MTKNAGATNGNWRGAEMREYLRGITETGVNTSKPNERKAAAKAAMTCECGGRKEAWMPICRHCQDYKDSPAADLDAWQADARQTLEDARL